VWQTYDYFFEPTAAYYGCKKGSEPLHIQWNCANETIEVVNYNAGRVAGLTASAEILNMDGKRVDLKSATLDSDEDSTSTCINMKYPAEVSPVHFLRLALSRGSETLSSNFYMRGVQQNDFRAIRQLPAPKLSTATTVLRKGNVWELSTRVRNTGSSPALMVRLKAVRSKTGDRILPAIYSDNYFALMPAETCTIVTQVNEADTRGEKPTVVLG